MRLRLLRRWLPVALLVVVWAFGWLAAWRLLLFDMIAVDAGPQATLFADEGGDLRTLWVGVGTALVLGTFGYLLLVSSSSFSTYSRAWSRVWLAFGSFLVVVGLVAPVLYPSTTVMVVDPGRDVVALEQREIHAFRQPTAIGYQSKSIVRGDEELRPLAFTDAVLKPSQLFDAS